MADNGKIIRNGAEIQIDENGNVVARPATGQDFIVEDDARVGSLEAERVSSESDVIGRVVGRDWEIGLTTPPDFVFDDLGDYQTYKIHIVSPTLTEDFAGSVYMRLNGVDTNTYRYVTKNGSALSSESGEDKLFLFDNNDSVTISGEITITATQNSNRNGSISADLGVSGSFVNVLDYGGVDEELSSIDKIEIFGQSDGGNDRNRVWVTVVGINEPREETL